MTAAGGEPVAVGFPPLGWGGIWFCQVSPFFDSCGIIKKQFVNECETKRETASEVSSIGAGFRGFCSGSNPSRCAFPGIQY